jgi:acetyl esterase/lipase
VIFPTKNLSQFQAGIDTLMTPAKSVRTNDNRCVQVDESLSVRQSSMMKKWLKRVALATFCLLAIFLGVGGYLWGYYHPKIERANGVVYGMRNGTPLTLDVIRPDEPNGLAIAYMVSGGWRSQKAGDAPAWLMAPLLRRGYTIFAVCHVSQPDCLIPDIIDDMHRSIRYIRYHADEYRIDPKKIGVTGGSAGGHLSLMLATRGGSGAADADDPIDRESSAVQAVAIFYPVTDLLHLGESTENLGDGGPPKSFVKAFGDAGSDRDLWQKVGKECSPIYFVDASLPPTLIYHGDADTLVPLDQSQRFQAKAKEIGKQVELVVQPGGEHGWPTMILDLERFGEWFDRHLR